MLRIEPVKSGLRPGLPLALFFGQRSDTAQSMRYEAGTPRQGEFTGIENIPFENYPEVDGSTSSSAPNKTPCC